MYQKINGQYINIKKVYKKISNIWREVQIEDLTEKTIYINKDGSNQTASPSYQLVSGYSPSTTETNSEGRVQFQTSSSYTGGTITILMKIKINFS